MVFVKNVKKIGVKMNLKKYKNLFFIIIAIFLVCVSIANTIISFDLCHLEECKLEHCTTCRLIHMAINFVNNIGILLILILLFDMIIPIVYLIRHTIKKYLSITLIASKVQLNE